MATNPTRNEKAVLVAIANEMRTVGDLAVATRLGIIRIVPVIDGLARRGLVVRSKFAGEGWVQITEAGKEAIR